METEMMSEQQRTPFASMGYEPVGAVVNKLVARYLRTQRKNMLRLFQERGLYKLADQMRQIRKSNRTMLEKNRRFQGVLNEYAALTQPAMVADNTSVPQSAPVAIADETEAENP
jgi:hypothetical protein